MWVLKSFKVLIAIIILKFQNKDEMGTLLTLPNSEPIGYVASCLQGHLQKMKS